MALENNTDFGDLMDLGMKNKRAALTIFKREYEYIPFELSARGNLGGNKSIYTIDLIEDKIVIQHFKYFKKFIDIFGHLVKDLRIEVDEFSSKSYKLTEVYKVISKRCTSLKELCFFYDENAGDFLPCEDVGTVMSDNPLRITSSIPSLETFTADNVYLKTRMKMNTCFPKLESLRLLAAGTYDPKFIEVHMPSLKELHIASPDEDFEKWDDGSCDDYDDDDDEDDDEDDDADDDEDEDDDENSDNDDDLDAADGKIHQFDRHNVENMIRLNNQLECIDLDMEMDIPFLKFIRDSLPSLRKLELGSLDFDDHNGGDIVFENVETLCFKDVSEIVSMLPITSNSLVHLELMTGQNEFAIEYIKRQRSLITLRLECEYNLATLLELIASLPDLKNLSLKIEGGEWVVNGVKRLLTECERLDAAEISFDIKSAHQRWRSSISNIWNIENDSLTGYYTFTKK